MNAHLAPEFSVTDDYEGQASIRALLQPRSIALVGASDRAETLGRAMVDMALVGGYQGAVYAINPKYQQIGDVPCFAGASELPEVVDHVVPHRGDRMLFWDSTNWQALCSACHRVIKPALESRWEAGEVQVSALRLDRALPSHFGAEV